jgi:acyl-homoserine-lactone acylase
VKSSGLKKIILLILLPAQLFAQSWTVEEIGRWEKEAHRVTIIRDQWGIPHVYGKSDADAVFGLLYAQCEDDFPRIELNYIEKLGRMAELKGASELYNDLLIRMVIDSADATTDYKKSPIWLKKLLDAFADGINYYLYKNRTQKTALLKRFQPWYPLLWTDGSISAINTAGISSGDLRNVYSGGDEPVALEKPEDESATGSNGFAIAPSKSASGHAMLYINPHVSFYFREEVHVVSEEGLNAYGAVTWGQFFVYQGFNQHCGWMHTSSAVDVADLYAEKIVRKENNWFYEYEKGEKPIIQKKIRLNYATAEGSKTREIIAWYTHHGPVMAKRKGQWLSMKAQNRSMNGLIQSWQRTKAINFTEFKAVMDLKQNTSNNTVYADAEGNIAYWHGNFVPRRDTSFDWSKPVDGTIAATEWKGLHTMDEVVHIYNPPNGWIQNCNSTPFSVAGNNSPLKSRFPEYMAPDGENFRAVNAVRVLSRESSFTIDKLIAAGYDTYLAAFEQLIPALVKAFDMRGDNRDSIYRELRDPIELLRNWDYYAKENSVATTLAIEWGQTIQNKIFAAKDEYEYVDPLKHTKQFLASANPMELVESLLRVVHHLRETFGDWKIAWGSINRYQRISGKSEPDFDDQQASLPVAMSSSTWGCLPSFVSRSFPPTKKRYGISGNSFICAVEFGKKIQAKSLLTGGESGHPDSKHFTDQAAMYTRGQFKDVLFYKEDVLQHAEKTYHPGK